MLSQFVVFFRLHLRSAASAVVRRNWWPLALLLALMPVLQSCQTPVSREPGTAELAPLDIDPAARLFRLRTDQSRLIVLVYRDGRLANLGHNHVISSSDLRGELYLADDLQNSSFEIRLPVSSMEVDLPRNRADAGDAFPGELDPEAISGTRANMLGEQQLDAEVWPEIVLRSRRVRGTLPDITVEVEVAVRMQVHAFEIPMQVVDSDERIIATGSFQLNQTDLGIEPFSVMMGALKVRDQLDIEFSIVAEAEKPPGR